MYQRLYGSILLASALTASLVMTSLPTRGQDDKAAPAKAKAKAKSAPTPRTADGKVDLSRLVEPFDRKLHLRYLRLSQARR